MSGSKADQAVEAGSFSHGDLACVAEALPQALTWTAEPPLAELPAAPAVYQLQDAAGRHVLLAMTQHLRRAVAGRLSVSAAEAPNKKADLTAIVRQARWRRVSCAFEARWWHYRLARVLHPKDYRKRISFRPAWFLHVDWAQPFAEIRVTDRAWIMPGEFLGPWPSQRTAGEALQGLWELFDLCRYPEQIRRAPHGVRCAYYDMGRCDAPCDGTAAADPYVERSRAAWRFARGGAADWIEQATARMRTAAKEQQFERAALLKGQIAFAQRWCDEWRPHVRELAEFNYLIALPVTRRKAWKLFAFRAGAFIDGPLVKSPDPTEAVRAWGAGLAPASDEPEALVRMEQTWLMAHLLHSREGRDSVCVAFDRVVS